jgi:hypothetical protein
MKYVRNIQVAIPGLLEKIAELLTGKDVDWKIEQKDAVPYRGSGIAGTIDLPSGWATLTVEASDSTLRQDLTDLIERIEKDHEDKLFPPRWLSSEESLPQTRRLLRRYQAKAFAKPIDLIQPFAVRRQQP